MEVGFVTSLKLKEVGSVINLPLHISFGKGAFSEGFGITKHVLFL